MTVSDYNRGRSVNDLQLKTWEHGKTANMRSDSIWLDDRYNPIEYSHPNRNDNVNFPQQEFKDFFGRTEGTAAKEDYEKHRLSLSDSTQKLSTSMPLLSVWPSCATLLPRLTISITKATTEDVLVCI